VHHWECQHKLKRPIGITSTNRASTAGAAQTQIHNTTASRQKGRGKMEKHEILMELENIQYKYERLTSLIGILQQFVAEQVDIAGAPERSLNDALYEIELGMDENNNRLKELFRQKGGMVE
jgi:hypothetical protein